ncbi:MAG TPA: hypothetical protein VJ781_03175, partial [Pyrinomonadaceae bacterium]|nr:hypothetical protein [Pyrinomonadaceae bacterium]
GCITEGTMTSETDPITEKKRRESGAALATVLLIAFLLLTASVMLLSGVAAGTRNGTDMLSETKAFYAAESGLQATINALRHRNPKLDYSQAAANPSMNSYITYNCDPGIEESRKVAIGLNPNCNGDAYRVSVSDPDNYAAGLKFRTDDVQTKFTSYTPASGTNVGVITGSGTTSTVTYTATPAPPPNPTPTPDPPVEPTPTPEPTPLPQLIITMTAKQDTEIIYDGTPEIPALVDFSISSTGAVMPNGDQINFQIVYTLTAPRTDAPKKTIFGKVTSVGGVPTVTLDTPTAELVGSTMTFCAPDPVANCTYTPIQLAPETKSIYGNITPVEPVRLLVKSTGFGPFGAKKELEAILRKDLPNMSIPPGLHTMVGGSTCPADYPTCLGFSFAPGTSNGVAYSGCDPITGVCVPSFILTDSNNYQYVSTHPPSGNPNQMQPPPQMSTTANLPAWQQSPAALDAFVDEMRTIAQGSDRYFRSPNGDGTTTVEVPNNPGDFGTGTGITFCEGSCQVGGSGGGIMVVTGKLTNTGNFSFRGLIVVTGEEGWLRNGGGNGQIIGNVVIAPYNLRNYVPENHHLSSFLPPRYAITGGGGSDIIAGDISSAFASTSGVSDIIQGIAEK